MKTRSLQKLLLLVLLICGTRPDALSQYWQQKLDYVIDVTLNDKEKTLDGFEKIVYYNQSPDTLHFIWFHLWPNAYKNDRTAFSDQLLENGNTRFYFSEKEERGYINRLDFKVDGITAKTEDHPAHIDIVKLLLPKPLPPGQQVSITTPFHVKLPFNFSRGGYDGESFQLTQWYPKPAVYDKNGWHPMPYLDQGEFYSEFASFDVRITLPKNYVVAATGELQNEEEKQWLKTRKDFSWKPVSITSATNKNAPPKKTVQRFPASATETKTIRYLQNQVHDFAWFADKRFVVDQDTCLLPSGKVVEVFAFYTPAEQKTWKNSIRYAKEALRFYSFEMGEYPFKVLSVVQGPESFGGGMEYPTITVISPTGDTATLDGTIAHEVGHNWFYGILASNERAHPWMDEGLNSFYDLKYFESKYGKQSRYNDLLYLTKHKRKTAQPLETASENFSEGNYFLSAYHATAMAMRELEKAIGPETFRQRMQQYYQAWKFKHPQPENFKSIMGIQNVDTLLDEKQLLENKWTIVHPLKKGFLHSFYQQPTRQLLLLAPAIGANSYDKLMIGGLVSNYKLPPSDLNFLAVPLYGTGSKKFTGIGRINYSIHAEGMVRKTDIFLNASLFTMDEFKDTAGRKLVMQFRKLVPGMKFTFRNGNPRNTVNSFVQWKTFLIGEDHLRIRPDTIFNGTDTIALLHYLLPREKRYLNQLQLVYENYRALYPFRLQLQMEQARDFLRPALTVNYFFNYKEGGLQLRFFAGKFIYLGEKTLGKQFANDRYHLNMTGPKGYEDYTYSDYFIGRNRFEGIMSQQIMIRDGGFKVRTDLLANKIGKTDNWLAALNFSSSIPEKLNPLSLLPLKIPLHIFFDIGTYAEAWNRESEGDRFLYDLGLHIPLFDETIHFYFPVLYNREYRDYFKSTLPKNRFFRTMSFTINLYNKGLQKTNRELEF